MPSEIVVDNEYITLQYLSDHGIIHHTIHKPIPDQPLKDALEAGGVMLKKNAACKWLSDDRKNGPLSPEIQAFGYNDWGPRTIAAGWKYWANVVPKEVAAAGALVPVMEAYYKIGLRMMVFTSVEESIQWLDKMKV